MSRKKKRGPTPPRKGTTKATEGQEPRVRVSKVTDSINVRPVVGYRVFMNDELVQEVPHTGKGGLQAVTPNITPGVTLRVGVQSVNSYGVTSSVNDVQGAAPFDH